MAEMNGDDNPTLDPPKPARTTGAAVGATAGAATGAAAGIAGGPVGAAIGAVAGAVLGATAGLAASGDDSAPGPSTPAATSSGPRAEGGGNDDRPDGRDQAGARSA